MEIALALAGIGAGRRGHHDAAVLGRHRQRRAARRRARRCSSTATRARATSTSSRVEAAITPRTRAILPVDLAGLPVDRDRLYAIAERPRPARHRGCGAVHRRELGGPHDRQLRRPGLLQLPRQQEHHHRRGRLPGAQRRGRGAALRAVAPAGRRAARRERTAWTSPWPAASTTSPTSPPASASGQLPRLDAVHGAPARAGAALLRALRPRPRLRAAARGLRAVQLAHVPGAAAGARRPQRLHRRACARPASASACTIRRCTCSPCTAQLGWKPGDFPHAERIGRSIVTPAAVPGHAGRRRRPGAGGAGPGAGGRRCRPVRAPPRRVLPSRPRAARVRERCDARDLARHPGLQRGGRAAGAVRAALSGARRARPQLRGHLRRRRQPRPLGGAAARAVPAPRPTSRAWCCSPPISASTWRSWPASRTRAAAT